MTQETHASKREKMVKACPDFVMSNVHSPDFDHVFKVEELGIRESTLAEIITESQIILEIY